MVQVLQHTITYQTYHLAHHHNLTQSSTDYQHSQSTIHVQTPTLMVNGPQFQPNLQQLPPALVVQTNQPTNYHTQQQQANTLLTQPQPFNTHLPQSFNPQVPPPYFP